MFYPTSTMRKETHSASTSFTTSKGEEFRKMRPRFRNSFSRNLGSIDQEIEGCQDPEERKELKQMKRLLRNRQAALDSRQRKRAREIELELEYTSANGHMSDDDLSIHESINTLWKSRTAALQTTSDAKFHREVPEAEKRPSDRKSANTSKERKERLRQDHQAARAFGEHTRAYMQELDARLERMDARFQRPILYETSRSEEHILDRCYKNTLLEQMGAEKPANVAAESGFRTTLLGNLNNEQPSTAKTEFDPLQTGYNPSGIWLNCDPALGLSETSVSQPRDSFRVGNWLPSFKDGNQASVDDKSCQSIATETEGISYASLYLETRITLQWSCARLHRTQMIGHGTAATVFNCASLTDNSNTPSLRHDGLFFTSNSDPSFMSKDGPGHARKGDLGNCYCGQEPGKYSLWSVLRRVLGRDERLWTAMVFFTHLTGAVASPTELQPAASESLFETTILAACLGGLFAGVVCLERCKVAQVLTPLMIVMPFACLDLGRDAAFPERQLLVVSIFSASLNIMWLKDKLADLPRTGGLTTLIIVALGVLSAASLAYYLPVVGGRYADRFILAAVSALLTTMIWSIIWVAGFYNLGLAQRLEIGVYDERIGAFTKRIFDTWINQLVAQVCESLISRAIGSNSLPEGTKRQGGDVEAARPGLSKRSDSYWAAANGPRTPPQSGVVSPLSLATAL
ncbi:hypothetical protein DL98DRAFT_647593 [Cadophora sp. DSE1049]|nr:hypothetical protein DL98DRAFT_647593 [Cadophora sp. DSE1049]